MAGSVVELRQYTLHPGRREELVALFDGWLVEPQEELGMRVLGQFRDLDDPDRFVWLRGFDDMAARHSALEAFYGGPIWARHKEAANATMIDSDDVLLLRQRADAAALSGGQPSPVSGSGAVVVTTHHLSRPVSAEAVELFMRMDALLSGAGSSATAILQTESAANTFPALPVREGEHVLVRVARFGDRSEHVRLLERMRASPSWTALDQAMRGHLVAAPQHLYLEPTARSRLR